jgi:hypothetical protein
MGGKNFPVFSNLKILRVQTALTEINIVEEICLFKATALIKKSVKRSDLGELYQLKYKEALGSCFKKKLI